MLRVRQEKGLTSKGDNLWRKVRTSKSTAGLKNFEPLKSNIVHGIKSYPGFSLKKSGVTWRGSDRMLCKIMRRGDFGISRGEIFTISNFAPALRGDWRGK